MAKKVVSTKKTSIGGNKTQPITKAKTSNTGITKLQEANRDYYLEMLRESKAYGYPLDKKDQKEVDNYMKNDSIFRKHAK